MYASCIYLRPTMVGTKGGNFVFSHTCFHRKIKKSQNPWNLKVGSKLISLIFCIPSCDHDFIYFSSRTLENNIFHPFQCNASAKVVLVNIIWLPIFCIIFLSNKTIWWYFRIFFNLFFLHITMKECITQLNTLGGV